MMTHKRSGGRELDLSLLVIDGHADTEVIEGLGLETGTTTQLAIGLVGLAKRARR